MDNKHTLCLVKWDDAWAAQSTYYSGETEAVPMVLYDVGFICQEDEEGILLASSMCLGDDGLRHLKFIPTGMIVEITEFEYDE